jgi:hypothetical protein
MLEIIGRTRILAIVIRVSFPNPLARRNIRKCVSHVYIFLRSLLFQIDLDFLEKKLR